MPVRSRWHTRYRPVPARSGSGSSSRRPTVAAAAAATVAAAVVHAPAGRRRQSRGAADGGAGERRPLVAGQWQQWPADCRTPARQRAMPDQGGRRSPTQRRHHGLRSLLGAGHRRHGEPEAAGPDREQLSPPPRIERRVSDSSPLRCLYPWASEGLLSTLDDFGVCLPGAVSDSDLSGSGGGGGGGASGGESRRTSLRPPRLRLSLSMPRRPSESQSLRRSSELINSDIEFAPFTPCSEQELAEWRAAAARLAPPPLRSPPAPVQLRVPETGAPVVDVCAGLVSLTVGLPPPPSVPSAPLLEAALRPVAEVCAGLVRLSAGEEPDSAQDSVPPPPGVAVPGTQAQVTPQAAGETAREVPRVVVEVTPPGDADRTDGTGDVKTALPARTRRKAFICLNQVSRPPCN